MERKNKRNSRKGLGELATVAVAATVGLAAWNTAVGYGVTASGLRFDNRYTIQENREFAEEIASEYPSGSLWEKVLLSGNYLAAQQYLASTNDNSENQTERRQE